MVRDPSHHALLSNLGKILVLQIGKEGAPPDVGQRPHDSTKNPLQFTSKETCCRDFGGSPIQDKRLGFLSKEGEPDSSIARYWKKYLMIMHPPSLDALFGFSILVYLMLFMFFCYIVFLDVSPMQQLSNGGLYIVWSPGFTH